MASKDPEIQLNQTTTIQSQGDDTKGIIAAKDVDEALVFLQNNLDVGQVVHIDDKKLMRKVDWMLMPLMFACYYLQYTDKTLLSYSGIMGIIEDTNMPENGFSNLAIAFYVSFLVCEPIQSVLLQKFPTAKWLGANVICWGIVLTMNCVCHNYASLVALRVLLGVFESVTAPSLVILTSMWYKRHEQVMRMGWWYQGSSVGPMVSSLVAFGFGHWTASDPTISFKSWQVLFLMFGLITILFGILTFFFLPDNPFKSHLTPEEKMHILERVRENQTGIENKKFKRSQFMEVILDVRTWLLSLIVILTNVPNGAVSSFSSIIIQNFGYDEYQSLLLNLPGCGVALFSVWAGAYLAGRFNARGITIILLIIPTLIGGALMAWLPPDNKGGLLTGTFLINTVGSTLPLLYSWITSNFAGHTKKITMNAIVLMSFCVGNIIGPETFQDKDGPQYIPAKITIVATLAAAIVVTVALDMLYWWDNKKRSNEEPQDLPPNYEFLDLTDKQNRNFRYLL
ncbi:major facilitator superfamily domain-containing protein [Xylogone sp. PMI_703]|nr:major facilitator superfamily domain-containing protein [Xylogone sp. PMI_703]